MTKKITKTNRDHATNAEMIAHSVPRASEAAKSSLMHVAALRSTISMNGATTSADRAIAQQALAAKIALEAAIAEIRKLEALAEVAGLQAKAGR